MAGTPQRSSDASSWQDRGGGHPSSRGSWTSAAAGDFGGGGGGVADEVEAELMRLLNSCGQDTQLLGRFNKELNDIADAVDGRIRDVRGAGTFAAFLPPSPFGSPFAWDFVRRDPRGRVCLCVCKTGADSLTQ